MRGVVIPWLERTVVLALALVCAVPAYPQPFQSECQRILQEEYKHSLQIASLTNQHKLRDARQMALDWIGRIKATCGDSNRPYAKALRELASIEQLLNDLAAARDLTEAALKIRQTLSDVSPLDVSANKMELAKLELELGRHEIAKRLLDEALADYRSLEDAYAPGLLREIFGQQALIHAWEGHIAEAEASIEKARRQLGVFGDAIDRMIFEARVARIYRDVGLLDVAERHLRESLAILNAPSTLEKYEQASVAQVRAMVASALARVLIRQGRNDEAAKLATEAVQTLQGLPEDMRWMRSAFVLPVIEAEIARGRPSAALEQAKEVLLGGGLPPQGEAEFQYAMAVAHGQLHQYADALQSIARAVAIERSSTTYPAPRLIRCLKLQAALLWANGDIQSAHHRYQEIQALFEQLLQHSLAALPEVRQRALLNAYAEDMSVIVSFHFAVKDKFPQSLGLAADTVLKRKGRQLDSSVGRLSLARMSQSEAALQAVSSLKLLNAQIAAERFDAAITGGQATSRREQELLRIQEGVERKLHGLLPAYLTQRTEATVKAVSEKLPSQAALVEYLRYRQVMPGASPTQAATGPFRYALFIITGRGGTTSIDLGEADRIDALVEAWLRAVLARDRDLTMKLGRQLDAAVLEPALQAAPGHQRLFVASDSKLASIPFAALVGPDGRHRVENRFVFSYLTTGSELLRPTNPIQGNSPSVVIGAPAFDRLPPDWIFQRLFEELGDIGTSPERKAQRLPSASGPANRTPEEDQARADRLLRGGGDAVRRRIGTFPDLPGAMAEVKAVAQRLGVAPIVGENATKLEFGMRTADRPWILHVASHAYVLSVDVAPGQGDLQRARPLFEDMELPAEHSATLDPMLLSGIVLTGVNKMPDYERALVSALELSALDLGATELVVLSACKTGAGVVLPGEGVIGLRRALELSGASASITSLWSISDQPTVTFMNHFYERFLKRGRDKADAVAEAQRAMLADPVTAAPALWAPFVLSGHTDPSLRSKLQFEIRYP